MPTTDCLPQIAFDFHPDRPISVTADAPRISSDGGLLLLRQADERIGITADLAACLPEDRDASRVQHPRLEQLRQRVYQIAMGYEDANDADTMRRDPVLKAACGLLPDDPQQLSSQPTLSRLENDVTGPALNAMIARYEEAYVASLPADTSFVLLDIDPTDDPTHGAQQLAMFHGFYDQHMLHPLLVFDGEGELVTVLLRPGNAHAARSATIVLRRLIRRIKRRFPEAQIKVRADSGFAMPRVLDALEALDRELGDVEYTIGIAQNSRLLARAGEAMQAAQERHEETGEHVRLFRTFRYAAKTWTHERTVVLKAEHHARGDNPRFVLTTLEDFDPRQVYDDVYCPRGQCENNIKDLKRALAADRLSCHRFLANAFRLLMHAVAYRLMRAVRSAVAAVSPAEGRVQFDTLRLRLLKVAAHVRQSARRISVQLPRVFPAWRLFVAVAEWLAAPPAAPVPAPG
jgi:hypothetical protein